jgi:hypothetical protein
MAVEPRFGSLPVRGDNWVTLTSRHERERGAKEAHEEQEEAAAIR